ncbi:unnamed protein product [Gongylonema pulchrum]|uniref:Neur_chan_memb domain-containing protein n=1 Tax=Gongylonema pulchrum TaxID=637853 RepID=A0A183EQD2_9BILA|nr:unnamed protein product [Gongylonema pulchrum]
MLNEDSWDALHAYGNVLCFTLVIAFVVAQLLSLVRKAHSGKRGASASSESERIHIPRAEMMDKQVLHYDSSKRTQKTLKSLA